MCACLHLFVCSIFLPGAHRGQKRALDALELDSRELPGGCWELILGPLKEQQVLLTGFNCILRHRLTYLRLSLNIVFPFLPLLPKCWGYKRATVLRSVLCFYMCVICTTLSLFVYVHRCDLDAQCLPGSLSFTYCLFKCGLR